MRPVDFVLFDGDSSPNTSVHEIAEALQRPLVVVTSSSPKEILSYYYDSKLKQLVLDIGE